MRSRSGGRHPGFGLGHVKSEMPLRHAETAGNAGRRSTERWRRQWEHGSHGGIPTPPGQEKEEKPAKESEQEWPVRGGEKEEKNKHQESGGGLEANPRKPCPEEEKQSAPSLATRGRERR